MIRANIEAVRLPGARLLADRVERVLARGPGHDPPRDLVFADPPYAAPAEEVAADAGSVARPLARAGRPGGRGARTRSGALAWPAGYTPERSRGYGEATLWYGLAAGARPAAESSTEG